MSFRKYIALKEKNERTKQLIKERDQKKREEAITKLAALEKKREIVQMQSFSAMQTAKKSFENNALKRPPISAKNRPPRNRSKDTGTATSILPNIHKSNSDILQTNSSIDNRLNKKVKLNDGLSSKKARQR